MKLLITDRLGTPKAMEPTLHQLLAATLPDRQAFLALQMVQLLE
uniref:Uncharacterized protein n=1 Tax=Rhizophora mucronata TaxID=61149 RepID=A0A2P2QKD4_RHIMU